MSAPGAGNDGNDGNGGNGDGPSAGGAFRRRGGTGAGVRAGQASGDGAGHAAGVDTGGEGGAHPGHEAGDEPAAVARRYARRTPLDPRYSLLNPAALCALHERQRATARLFSALGFADLRPLRLLEVGCGAGGNLLDFLRFGFAPEHLAGIELLAERVAAARAFLPAAVALHAGDACAVDLPQACADIVFQATVFSSLLDPVFQQRLADAMWRWAKPGGGVLWYDFTVDNPRNADVRGVPLARVRALFPHGVLRAERITLAPPLARAACRVHPALYGVLNALPWLRTHVLAWIGKP